MVNQMTLKEKTSQMVHEARGISRMNIPAYNWWNECLHGAGRAGTATVYPQPVGLGAMFNTPFMKEIAASISDEVRAKYNEVRGTGSAGWLPDPVSGLINARRFWYRGLTCWSPNINIFRDPRWGRGHETYGEDPYLTGRLGVAFIRGLQGDDPEFLKVVATPKHYAVHSGPEGIRHGFNARVGKKDLYETYLPAFREAVQEGKAASVMSAYNGVNGEPCTAGRTLLEEILRNEWGFDGFVVSDCGAVRDLYVHHKITRNRKEAAAMAVSAGCDLNCGYYFHLISQAVKQKYLSERDVDRAVVRLMEARLKLGMFEPAGSVRYDTISPDVIACEKHRDQALVAARQSMVLLKNEGLLPLKDSLSLAVIGPNADELEVLLGNYNGTPSEYTTPLRGIRDRFRSVEYARGCGLTGNDRKGFDEAVTLAGKCDAAVLCLGLSPRIEGEEGDAFNSDAGGDKSDLNLPGVQQELLEAVHAAGTPVVLVLLSGSPLCINWADEHIPAIVQAWYPGQEGGRALAEILAGDCSPSGRLPVTFVRSMEDLPPFEDYAMKGRTYRFCDRPALYPFGYGLSYSRFRYEELKIGSETVSPGENAEASVRVTNKGDVKSGEVVQFYLSHEARPEAPLRQLCHFERIVLEPGESRVVRGVIRPRQMAVVGEDGLFRLKPGRIVLYAGGSQPDERSAELTGSRPLETLFRLAGPETALTD